MLKELIELKNSGAVGIKIEFESEYYDEKAAFELAELVHRVDMNLCVKLGGVSSIQDLHISKKLCANSIVAPMVESAYAVKKFLLCVKQVFGNAYPDLYLNIETKNAFEHLDEIVDKASPIKGFVLGRSDLKNSMGIENPDDPRVFECATNLADISEMMGKVLIIGGKINSKSVEFLNKIQGLSYIETRKVIFDKNTFNEKNLQKSLEFELKCFNSKKELYKEDMARIDFIKKSLKVYA